MKSEQIRRLLNDGVTIEVTRQDGITERYDHTKAGEVVVTFQGGVVCKYCGHKLEHDANCRCDKSFEIVSLTGCYRHINSLAQKVDKDAIAYDEDVNKLYLEVKGGLAC